MSGVHNLLNGITTLDLNRFGSPLIVSMSPPLPPIQTDSRQHQPAHDD